MEKKVILLDADIREPLFEYLEMHHGKIRSEKLIAKIPAEILHQQISDELFERDYTIYD